MASPSPSPSPKRARRDEPSLPHLPRDILASIALRLAPEDRAALATTSKECQTAVEEGEEAADLPFWKSRLGKVGPLEHHRGGRWRFTGGSKMGDAAVSPSARWIAVVEYFWGKPHAVHRIDRAGAAESLPLHSSRLYKGSVRQLSVSDEGEVRFVAKHLVLYPDFEPAEGERAIVSWPKSGAPRVIAEDTVGPDGLDLWFVNASNDAVLEVESTGLDGDDDDPIWAKVTDLTRAKAAAGQRVELVMGLGVDELELGTGGDSMVEVTETCSGDAWLVLLRRNGTAVRRLVRRDGRVSRIEATAFERLFDSAPVSGRVCWSCGPSDDDAIFFRLGADGQAAEVEAPPEVRALYERSGALYVAWAAAARSPSIAVLTFSRGIEVVEVPVDPAWLDGS